MREKALFFISYDGVRKIFNSLNYFSLKKFKLMKNNTFNNVFVKEFLLAIVSYHFFKK